MIKHFYELTKNDGVQETVKTFWCVKDACKAAHDLCTKNTGAIIYKVIKQEEGDCVYDKVSWLFDIDEEGVTEVTRMVSPHGGGAIYKGDLPCTGSFTFSAPAIYTVPAFKTIQEWFNNRGVNVKRNYFKEWCIDSEFLYYTCTPGAPEDIRPDYDPESVMVCRLHSNMHMCNEEMEWKASPFANKI